MEITSKSYLSLSIILECGKMLARGKVRMEPVPSGQYERNADGSFKLGKDGKKIPIYKKDKRGKIKLRPMKRNGKVVRDAYDIKIFNTINFKKSMHYNPFAYIRKEEDIQTLVTTLIENTKGEGDKSGEDFWVKAEKLLYGAYIGYLYYEAPIEEQNFATLLELLNASECREDDENFKNAVDLLFEDLESQNPNHYAVRLYKDYKLAAGKTAKSILISCAARLAPFQIERIREITSYDELSLDTLGDHKTALFAIISDTDKTYNFLVSIMFTQLFNVLCTKADDFYGGRLPVHVRFLCDEFANIGRIPDFETKIATIRSREISASIILQSRSQLKTMYKDAAENIIDNCDTKLFLGGSSNETLKKLSEELGKETIDQRSVIGVAGAPGQTVGPAAKLHVQAVLDSHLGVVGTTPVAHHHAVILPVTLEYLIEGVLVLATVLVLIEVIGAHDAPGVTLLDSSLKGGQVNLTQGTVAHDDVDLMAILLIVVQTEVLDTRRSACRLQTLNVGHYHAGRQQGILAHVLKVAAIQWRAVDVHTRSQNHVLATIARFLTQAAAIQPGQSGVP